MSNRKPTLPPQSHIRMAVAVTDAVSGASDDEIESLPKSVRESLDYFAEVADTSARISVEQPEVLAEFREEFHAVVAPLLNTEDADAVVDALFRSYVMARLLADSAAGNVEPVAVTGRAKPAAKKAAAPAKKAAAKKVAAPRPDPAPAVSSTDPEPVAPPVDPDAVEPPVMPSPEIEESVPAAPERVASAFDQDPDDDF